MNYAGHTYVGPDTLGTADVDAVREALDVALAAMRWQMDRAEWDSRLNDAAAGVAAVMNRPYEDA